MGGPLLVKILILATLLLGTAVLVANFVASHPRPSRRRNILETLRRPGLTVTAMLGEPQAWDTEAENCGGDESRRVRKTEAEWKTLLTPEQYAVTREGRTERPFEGVFWDHFEDGSYHCAACAQPLFGSGAKFESATGWPSFRHPLTEPAVDRITDISYGKIRTEVVCARCESHLGHLFDDGPGRKAQRYTVNSAALTFVAASPADRPHKVG